MADIAITLTVLIMLAIQWLASVAAVVVGVWIAQAWQPRILHRIAATRGDAGGIA